MEYGLRTVDSSLPPFPLGFWRTQYLLRMFVWTFVERCVEKNARMHVELCTVLLTLKAYGRRVID
jgi:hypothetical protein